MIKGSASIVHFDISGIARFRARVGRAATSLKIIGACSGLPVFVAAYQLNPLCALPLLAVPYWMASVAANGMRSGRAWSFTVATIWWGVWSLYDLLVVLPKSLNGQRDFFTVIGLTICLAPLYFLGRGLLEVRSFRASGARRFARAGPLDRDPWERGRSGTAKRPRFLNKRSLVAYVFLVLTPLPWILPFLINVNSPGLPAADGARRAGQLSVPIVISLAVWVWMARIYRRARRAAMLPASNLVSTDTRTPVLYLRSFQDDSSIKVRARAADGRILLERLVRISFEELITDHLWSYGPVLAIGDPARTGEQTPLGAVREFTCDAEWQSEVTRLMLAASTIVLIIGRTDGLAWEIQQILDAGLLSKLVLLFPPVSVAEVRSRWEFLRSRLPEADHLEEIDFGVTRAVVFPELAPVLIEGKSRNSWIYETVLDGAALLIGQVNPGA